MSIYSQRNALWFSPSQPTEEQLFEADEMGYDIVAIPRGIGLGGININDQQILSYMVDGITAMLREYKAEAIFGVFPAPFLNYAFKTRQKNLDKRDAILLYSSWNVARPVEGHNVPVLSHHEWTCVGNLYLV